MGQEIQEKIKHLISELQKIQKEDNPWVLRQIGKMDFLTDLNGTLADGLNQEYHKLQEEYKERLVKAEGIFGRIAKCSCGQGFQSGIGALIQHQQSSGHIGREINGTVVDSPEELALGDGHLDY